MTDTTGTSAAGGEGQPWYGTLANPEIKGLIDNKGWKSVEDIATSYRHAETLIGTPAELRVNLPKDMKAAGAMDPIYNRLGRPETADKYSFKNEEAKGSDGKPLDAELDAAMRKALYPLGLTQDQAAGTYDFVKGLMKEAVASEAKEAELSKQAGIDALKKEWGSGYDANAKVATEAIEKLGLSADTVNKLRDLVGHAEVAKMFHMIGTKVVEPSFKGGAGNTEVVKPVMTREAAQHQKALLMEDRNWVVKYNSGDTAAREQMLNLNKIIAGA